MFKVNDYIVYKRDVCIIKEIRTNKVTKQKAYILGPIEDSSLTIEVPLENKFNSMRNIISKKEVEQIISYIPNTEILSSVNDKLIDQEYRQLLNTGNHGDLIKIIKTAYIRNNDRLNNGKKIGEKDDKYFQKAEKLLYNEFAIALNMTFDETKKYVCEKVEKNLK